MKLLIPLLKFYPAQTGGPANTLYWIAKNLAQHNIQPVIVTTETDILDPSIERNKWHRFEGLEVMYTTRFCGVLPWRQVMETVRLMATCDTLHLNSLFYGPNIIFATIASLMRKRTILSVRGELHPAALKMGRRSIKRLILTWYRCLPRNFVFHSTSKEESELIQKVFPSRKIIEIPNFIDYSVPPPREKENSFLFLGRVNPIKALEKLLQGLALSHSFKDSQYILTIAGAGDHEYMSTIQNLISELNLTEKVIFPQTFVVGTPKANLLSKAKFLFLVSESENFGNVVLESLTHGVIPVTTTGTPWSILQESKIGFHISNEPTQLCAVIDELINMSNDDFENRSKRARVLVEKEYSIKNNVSIYARKLYLGSL